MDTQKRRTAATQAPQSFRQSLTWWGRTIRSNSGLTSAIAITALLGVLFPAAWLPSHPTEPPRVMGDFQTRNYTVSDHEHVTVFDVPNRVFPTRCWIYVNERIATSTMQCDPNDDSGGLPTQGAGLER